MFATTLLKFCELPSNFFLQRVKLRSGLTLCWSFMCWAIPVSLLLPGSSPTSSEGSSSDDNSCLWTYTQHSIHVTIGKHLCDHMNYMYFDTF